MNIIVRPYGSDLCYCRPDTTWERENKDFYSPECVNEIHYAPVVFARVAKAGKCIGEKFVERYYDAVGCGILIYGCIGKDTLMSCIDKSSVLPLPMYNPVVMEDEKTFKIETRKGEEVCTADIVLDNAKEMLETAMCKSSELISLRIGDYVAVELEGARFLTSKGDIDVHIKGLYCENEIFDFKVIM